MKFTAVAAALLSVILVAMASGAPDERTPSRRTAPSKERVQRAESPDDPPAPVKSKPASRRAAQPQRVVRAQERPAAEPGVAVPVSQPAPAAHAPTPEEAAEARDLAARLLKCVDAGAVVLKREDREPVQLRELAADGYCTGPAGRPVAMAPELLRTVVRLAEQSSSEKPLVILSLYRPLSPGRPHEPHGNGMAVDIAAYAGHTIDSRSPDECVEAVVAIVKALAPGPYRLGLPRPPESEPTALTPAPERPTAWPFFPAPLPEVLEPLGLVAPRVDDGHFVLSSRGGARAQIIRWENERYAPLGDIGSPRVRTAIEQAIARGADIHSLFPDAADHLHLDVKPQP